MVEVGTLLWEPAADARSRTRIGRFLDHLEDEHGLDLPDQEAAWRWSVDDLEAFWSSIVAEFDVRFHAPPQAVLADRAMPGARWFPGATLNYAEHALRRRGDGPAVIARSQSRAEVTLSWAELADQVARARAGLQRLGVGRGDRVVGYLPNVPETLVAFLACASLGEVPVLREAVPRRREDNGGGVRHLVRAVWSVDPVKLFQPSTLNPPSSNHPPPLSAR